MKVCAAAALARAASARPPAPLTGTSPGTGSIGQQLPAATRHCCIEGLRRSSAADPAPPGRARPLQSTRAPAGRRRCSCCVSGRSSTTSLTWCCRTSTCPVRAPHTLPGVVLRSALVAVSMGPAAAPSAPAGPAAGPASAPSPALGLCGWCGRRYCRCLVLSFSVFFGGMCFWGMNQAHLGRRRDCLSTSCCPAFLGGADMDGFKLLEHLGLELDLPVISEQRGWGCI